MSVTIQLRRDTAANWTAANPVLYLGEIGVETDTHKAKFGDGVTAWNSLAYWSPAGAYLPLSGGTLTGELVVPDLKVSGLTGATAASRYAGATTSGAPVSGTFAVGDWVADQSGALWVCTTAGTPGTWTKIGSVTLTASDSSVTVGGTVQAPTVGSVPAQISQRMHAV